MQKKCLHLMVHKIQIRYSLLVLHKQIRTKRYLRLPISYHIWKTNIVSDSNRLCFALESTAVAFLRPTE